MGLRFCTLASGSKGNCCFVSDGHTDILIDLGISALRAEKCLKVLGASPDGVSVLITHSHSDHIGGLKVFCKKHPAAKVYCQRESMTAVMSAEGIVPLCAARAFSVGEMKVCALPVSHDVPCFGYVVEGGGRKVAVVTDIGKVSCEQLSALSSCNIVVLEANHDIEMLKANPRYTAMLKARIRSEHGHLSNADCAAACAYLAANGVKTFILAHLSEENNAPELAISAVNGALSSAGVTDATVYAARQDCMSGLYEIC